MSSGLLIDARKNISFMSCPMFTAMICAFSSLMCFIAQVWLYICIYEPCSVQVVGGIAAAPALVAFRRLRTSPRFIPWTDEHP